MASDIHRRWRNRSWPRGAFRSPHGHLFAIAPIDASIIGASAVSLSTAYAIGDTFGIRHSLHRSPRNSIAFYLVFAGLIAVSAALVLIAGTPFGLLTNAVQSLAGVLLPSATVFLLLLCNDKVVLGPWRNGRWLNLFTYTLITVLVLLPVILSTGPEVSADVGAYNSLCWRFKRRGD